MIEFYYRYRRKNFKVLANVLAKELRGLLALEKINICKSKENRWPFLTNCLTNELIEELNDLYATVELHGDRFPFFVKYLRKARLPKPTEKYRFADLFAGCGGLSEGLVQAGFNLTFVNELEPTFAETHYFNHDLSLDAYWIGDIHQLVDNLGDHSSYLHDLDLIAGGPPCQGFSMANRQRLIDDPRNHLYKAFLAILADLRPKFFLIENVKGMSKKISEINEDLHSYLGEEYKICPELLNAKDFGVPQNRERYFIIGNRLGVKPVEIFQKIRDFRRNDFVLSDALIGLPTLKPKRIKNNNSIESVDYGFTIHHASGMSSRYGRFINGGREPRYLLNHKNRYNNDRDIEIFGRLPQGANSLHFSIKDLMPYSRRNHIFKDKYFKLNEKQVCKTITSHMKFDCNMYIHPTESRGLSAREAARIQSFPDEYYIRGGQNQWFAQVGNAVPVKLAQVIGKVIMGYLG